MIEIQCDGWWEQDFFGRQTMESLTLQFANGEIVGNGQDIVGPFTMTGVMNQGNVAIDKQYLGQHAATYLGEFDGEGTMHGTWHIDGMSGPWAINMRGSKSGKPMEPTDIRDV